MGIGAAIAGGSALAGVAGSVMSSGASKSAADAQSAAATHAADLQEANYQQTRGDLQPYFAAGGALIGQAGAIFGAGNGNPLVPGSYGTPASSGGGAPSAPPPPLTANSQAVQTLAGQLTPSIQAAMQGGAASGSLAGGYTFQQTPATGATFLDGGQGEGTPVQQSPGSPGSFQLIGPNGQPVGSFSDDPSQANSIASALALGYGNAQQASAAPAASGGGAGGGSATPTLLGLNDSQYGIPALGQTDFVKAMGANSIGDLAFNPAEGNDFYKAMGVSGPAALSFNPTQATLDNMPGYQFERDQGLQATQNSAAAKGLGVSGAALKAAAGYAQGLASTDLTNYYNEYEGNLTNQANIFTQNYNNQLNGWDKNLNDLSSIFNNSLLNRFNINQSALQGAYSRMTGIAGLGENAAANAGNYGVQSAANAGSNLVGAANAQASGIVGSNNALVSGLQSAAGAPMNYLTYQALSNGVNGGTSGAGNPLAGGYVDTGAMTTQPAAPW